MHESLRQRASQIFLEVANFPASEQHDAAVGLCGNDEQLLAEVQAMLRANRTPQADTPTVTSNVKPPAPESIHLRSVAVAEHASAEEHLGSRIGTYKLLQLIGEGGFGS